MALTYLSKHTLSRLRSSDSSAQVSHPHRRRFMTIVMKSRRRIIGLICFSLQKTLERSEPKALEAWLIFRSMPGRSLRPLELQDIPCYHSAGVQTKRKYDGYFGYSHQRRHGNMVDNPPLELLQGQHQARRRLDSSTPTVQQLLYCRITNESIHHHAAMPVETLTRNVHLS